MIVCIRADASRRIGSGHVMRCLTLADRLRKDAGAEVIFICREMEGHLLGYIRDKGFEVKRLPGAGGTGSPDDSVRGNAHEHWLETPWFRDAEQTIACLASLSRTADWLILDHYAIDRRYEETLRPFVRKLMVIDDLADRPHGCDLLLDQNWDAESGARYGGLVDPGTRLLIGPRYALLRDEFAERRAKVSRSGAVRRILVSFGGVDSTGETEKALRALAPLAAEGVALTVLAGGANPRRDKIAAFCAELPNARCYGFSDRVAELMLEADLAVGAGGSTTWERCCLGLPSLTIATARNQEGLTERTAQAGAAVYLGRSEDVDAAAIREAALQLRRQPHRLLWMSARAMELTDGRGAERIVEEIAK